MDEPTKRTQFTFYESYEKGAEALENVSDKAQWYSAIARAALYGEAPSFDGEKAEVLRMMWLQVEPHLLTGRMRSMRAKGNQNARKKTAKREELKNAPEREEQIPEREELPPEPIAEPEPEEPAPRLPLPPKNNPFAEFGL